MYSTATEVVLLLKSGGNEVRRSQMRFFFDINSADASNRRNCRRRDGARPVSTVDRHAGAVSKGAFEYNITHVEFSAEELQISNEHNIEIR
jgi:hypothetical protein